MRIIPRKETLTIEFKSDIDCLDEKELVSEIVGMTNTEGGVLYLGVEDKREFCIQQLQECCCWEKRIESPNYCLQRM